MADAEVQLRVLSAGDRELKELKLKTDDQGTGVFDFPLPEQLTGRLQDDGDARIVLQANVTDIANQKQSRSVSRIVTAQPLKIEVIPETGALVQDIANRVYLFVSYPDGQPAAQARVMVSDRDQELITGSLGVAAYEFTPRSQSMSLTVKARDANDNVGRRTVTLECGQGTDDFIVRTDKAVYNGGETMRVSVLGGGGQPLFLDFIKDGQTVLTEVVPVKQGAGEYQFDLPADLFGTIEMVAYRYHTAGIPVRKSRVLYV
ncbi:MAG: alpha-2-macroglobulin domain-containing protein, partial [bacterium]